MAKNSWLGGPSTEMETIIENQDGRTYLYPLVRGPLWPNNEDPPSFGRERQDGVIETSKGDFGSIDQMATFFGCVVRYDGVRSIDSN